MEVLELLIAMLYELESFGLFTLDKLTHFMIGVFVLGVKVRVKGESRDDVFHRSQELNMPI